MTAQTALSVDFQLLQGQVWLLGHSFFLLIFFNSFKSFPRGPFHFHNNVMTARVQVFSGTFLCVAFVLTELIKDSYKERKMGMPICKCYESKHTFCG